MPIALRQTGPTVVAARQHRCLATARAKNPTYKIPEVFRSQGSTVFKTPVVVFRHTRRGRWQELLMAGEPKAFVRPQTSNAAPSKNAVAEA